MTQKIVPNIWFNRNADEAIDFYMSVFEDGKILSKSKYPTEGLLDFQESLAGKTLTIEFELMGQHFTAINAGDEFTLSEAVSFAIMCEDQTEIDYYWEKLSAVPESEQCGWCKDKFGMSWQIVPKNMDELMKNPGAWEKMLNMKKLVIEEF